MGGIGWLGKGALGETGAERALCIDRAQLGGHIVMAHLRSPGKGANKTPPDCVASDLPQVG